MTPQERPWWTDLTVGKFGCSVYPEMASRGQSTKQVGNHVALLRGLNVGGNNRLPMKDLAATFSDAGCSGVVTYIQSGNVVFHATLALAARISSIITKELADRFDIRTPVLTRTAAELRQVVQANPFPRATEHPKTLHVAFLAEKPKAAAIAAIDPNRSPPDEVILRAREVYLHCPNGLARTKFTNDYFDSKLTTTSTMRNWNTVVRLLALAEVARS